MDCESSVISLRLKAGGMRIGGWREQPHTLSRIPFLSKASLTSHCITSHHTTLPSTTTIRPVERATRDGEEKPQRAHTRPRGSLIPHKFERFNSIFPIAVGVRALSEPDMTNSVESQPPPVLLSSVLLSRGRDTRETGREMRAMWLPVSQDGWRG